MLSAADAIEGPIADKAKKKLMRVGLTGVASVVLAFAVIFGIAAAVKQDGTKDTETEDTDGSSYNEIE